MTMEPLTSLDLVLPRYDGGVLPLNDRDLRFVKGLEGL